MELDYNVVRLISAEPSKIATYNGRQLKESILKIQIKDILPDSFQNFNPFLLFLYIFWHSTLKDLPQTTSLTYFCIYRTCYRQLLLHAALVYKKCHIARHVSCYMLAIRHYLSNLQILSIFYLWLNSFGVYRCLGIPSTITGDTSP